MLNSEYRRFPSLPKSGSFFYNRTTTDYYQLVRRSCRETALILECRNLRTTKVETLRVGVFISDANTLVLHGVGVFRDFQAENKRVYYNLDLC